MVIADSFTDQRPPPFHSHAHSGMMSDKFPPYRWRLVYRFESEKIQAKNLHVIELNVSSNIIKQEYWSSSEQLTVKLCAYS